MFMSENICIVVDIFVKAVAEGGRLSLWKRGRKGTTRHRNIYIHIATQPQ